jgi:hypothetical protein
MASWIRSCLRGGRMSRIAPEFHHREPQHLMTYVVMNLTMAAPPQRAAASLVRSLPDLA